MRVRVKVREGQVRLQGLGLGGYSDQKTLRNSDRYNRERQPLPLPLTPYPLPLTPYPSLTLYPLPLTPYPLPLYPLPLTPHPLPLTPYPLPLTPYPLPLTLTRNPYPSKDRGLETRQFLCQLLHYDSDYH